MKEDKCNANKLLLTNYNAVAPCLFSLTLHSYKAETNTAFFSVMSDCILFIKMTSLILLKQFYFIYKRMIHIYSNRRKFVMFRNYFTARVNAMNKNALI